jgi:hypothetical protein
MIDISPVTNLEYIIDFDYVAFANLPTYYRRLINFRILQVINSSKQTHFDNTFKNDKDILYTQTYVSNSRLSLEAYINDYFNTTGITIVNSQKLLEDVILYRDQFEIGDISSNQTYLYQIDELLDPEDELNTHLYNKLEVNLDSDFYVNVPSSLLLTITQKQIEAFVEKYKSVGTIYQIVIV